MTKDAEGATTDDAAIDVAKGDGNMFEAWTTGLGAIGTIALAILKLLAVVAIGWWWVAAPLIVGVALALVKNGVDVGDFLPD